jgi:ABC-type uncharacterized transport system permease subunit
MLLPIALVEPLKVVAVCVAGDGHWLTGTGIMIVAYGMSFVIVERLFKLVQPKLMDLNWFARAWIWYNDMRHRVAASFRAARVKCAATMPGNR